ncbi:TKL protein kinase [Aphanomyces invadans]|uniref:TKL protein kinase n=1 Tax=Aphanomyces invadans TaxID=157072 RepID=A0A024UH25_9STRA|nr:TKL protein kinase [Aphanomyces invadans]ETW05485.1 TKL protein kinase [Aphanomyces invadans]|eukprot:XP_008865262.1 TKL protein kinase [Aphanomyces invadans]
MRWSVVVVAWVAVFDLPTTSATVWQGNIVGNGTCHINRLCNVSAPTLTTKCAGVEFDQANWVKPDDVTCVWFPNGTVWRGMNRTRYSPFVGSDTRNVKNEIRGGIHVSIVESWPNSAHLLILNNLGIDTIPDDSSVDANGVELLALQIQLDGNNLTKFDSKLSAWTKELVVPNNRIQLVNLTRTNLGLVYLQNNSISDTVMERADLPRSLTELSLAGNNLTMRSLSWLPPGLKTLLLDNNTITTLPPLASWPASLTNLSLQHNALTELTANFPANLSWLCLGGNPIQTVYANASQFDLLSRLSNTAPTSLVSTVPLHSDDLCHNIFSTVPSNASCHGHVRTELLFGTFPICILPDSRAAPETTLPPPSVVAIVAHTTSTLTAWSIALVALGTVGAIAVVICVVVCCRRRRQRLYVPPSPKIPWYDEQHDVRLSPVTCRLHLDVRFEDQFLPFRIPATAIERRRVVARGGFGIVYEALWSQSTDPLVQVPVALKRLLPTHVDDAAIVDDFMHEIRVYSTLDHPNIVHFYGIAWTNISNLAIVMEFMPRGDVWSLLLNAPPTPWHMPLGPSPHTSKYSIAIDVLHALVYLHSRQVIHRDIKARNVLLSETMESKLTDFGTSRGRLDLTMTAEIGTAAWIAPEVLKGVRYTEQADIYSFGVLLSELDTVMMPYADLCNQDKNASVSMTRTRIAVLVINGDIAPSFQVASPIRLVASQCLRYNPDERPTAQQVLDMLCNMQTNSTRLWQPSNAPERTK